jgi:RND family efflux transporter MFP subunit
LLGLSDDDIKNLAASDPNYLTVRSTVSGFILDKKAVIGNSVNAGDALFTVGNFDKVWFSGDIYQEDLSKIHKGQDVVIDSTDSEDSVRGKISFISPVVDPTTRTIKIRVLMDNPKGMLRSDMYVEAHIILNMTKAILVPETSVLQINGRSYIFVQSQDSPDIFERLEVETAGKYRDKIVIKSGLNGNGKIVSEGALLLNAILKNGSDVLKK